MDNIEIKIYHPDKLDDKKIRVVHKKLPKPPFRMSLVGFTGSGKSNLIKNVLFNNKWGYNSYFDTIIVVCGSTDDCKEYERLAKQTKVPLWWEEKDKFYKSKKEDLIDKMIINQSADEEDIKEILKELEDNHENDSTLLVLDDMIVDKLFRNKVRPNVIDEIYVRGRHIGKGMSVIISTQKYMILSQNIRFTNSSQIVVYFGTAQMELEAIARENGYEYEELLAIMDKLANDKFMFFILNQKAPREKAIQDMKFNYVRIERQE
jgi:hypothetical protein